MLIRIAGGRLYDPVQSLDGQVADIYVRDGRIIPEPPKGTRIDHEFDARGKVVMAGAIDLHSHIAGGKMNLARALMTDDHRDHLHHRQNGLRSGSGHATPSTFLTGYRYAEMGYTAAFEPAIVASNARHAHLEMADIPLLDKGGYLMLGNEDALLRMLAEGRDQAAINDYVAVMLRATQTLAVKVVNAGGINAFKWNGRWLDLDEQGPHYGVTPRQVLTGLARAVKELGLSHPLHIHCNNLGVPGNVDTTLRTIEALDGLPLHLTHVQFHSYGTEGDRKFSSAAARIAEAVNARPNVSVDVGQIMFGQTITASGDTMTQHRNAGHADPRKAVCMDIECDGGCGLVPFRYRDKSFVNALQWAIGLELFLLVEDPWRIFLTTDHPNGAPFTSYPHLIRLLMDKTFRNEKLAQLSEAAQAATILGSLEREYSLYEIAILTRAAPARSLGLLDRGNLAPGAAADIVIYEDLPDREAMFTTPRQVFKDGQLIVEDGRLVAMAWGSVHAAHCETDGKVEKELDRFLAEHSATRLSTLTIQRDHIESDGRSRLHVHNPRRTA